MTLGEASKDDSDQFRQLCESMRGKVGAYADIKNQKIVGKIDIETGWLVVGEIPEDAEEEALDPEQQRVIGFLRDAKTQLYNKARENGVRQINVNRNKTFDALMAFLRSGQFSKVSCGLDDEFVEHCTDMRRVKDWNMRTQEIQFKWVKSEQGDDHWWFALSYAFLAKHVIGTGATYGGALPLLHTFKVKQVAS